MTLIQTFPLESHTRKAAFPHEICSKNRLQINSSVTGAINVQWFCSNADKDAHSRNRISNPIYLFHLLCGGEKLLAFERFEILQNMQKISSSEWEKRRFEDNISITINCSHALLNSDLCPKFLQLYRKQIKVKNEKEISVEITWSQTLAGGRLEESFYVSSNL